MPKRPYTLDGMSEELTSHENAIQCLHRRATKNEGRLATVVIVMGVAIGVLIMALAATWSYTLDRIREVEQTCKEN